MSEDTTTSTDVDSGQAQETEQLDTSTTQAVQADEVDTSEADTTNQTSESDDTDILEWASKKNIDVENIDKTQLLKMVKESEQKMHSATQEANALKTTVQTVGSDEGLDDTSLLLNRLKVTEFYINNPDAKSLDEDMAKIVNEKPYLADDLETVLEIARARRYTADTLAARQAGRKEALAVANKAEQAAPPQTSATTKATKTELTDADFANMSTAEYLEFKKNHPEFNPFK